MSVYMRAYIDCLIDPSRIVGSEVANEWEGAVGVHPDMICLQLLAASARMQLPQQMGCDDASRAISRVWDLFDQNMICTATWKDENNMICQSKAAEMASELHTAVRNGDVTALQAAIAAGADINGKDQLKRTPLVLAAWAGNIVSPQRMSLVCKLCTELPMTISSFCPELAGDTQAAPGSWGICYRCCCG
jgi:ankyrin repeat protein